MALKRIIVFAAGIALALFVVSLFGLHETIAALLRTRLDVFLVCVALQLASVALIVLRIKILARSRGYLSYSYATRLTLSGVFVSMITPFAKLGGEPLKMYMLGKNIGKYNASAAIAVESLVELLSSFVVMLVVTLVFFSSIPADFISLFIAVLAVLSVGIALFAKLISSPHWLHGIGRWAIKKLERFYSFGDKDHMSMFSNSMAVMWKRKSVVYGAFSVSVLSKIIEIARFWFVFLALGVALPFTTAVVVWTILLVIVFIPWLPGSLGLVEFSGISALIVMGVPQSAAASIMILDRFLSLWLTLLIGMAALSWAKRRNELPRISMPKKGGKSDPSTNQPSGSVQANLFCQRKNKRFF